MSGFQNAIGALSSIGFSANSAPVSIGNITLSGVEVPALLSDSGAQGLVITQLPGGARVIQAMGDQPTSITLGGMFIGPSAQTRSLLFKTMRAGGAVHRFAALAYSAQVVIKDYTRDLSNKAIVVPYRITLEILPAVAQVVATTNSSLSALVGSDLAASITNVTNTITTVTAYAQSAISQAQNVVGQITPIASLIGLGGPLATVGTYLQGASFYTQAGQDFAATPAAAATMISGIGNASSTLMTTISDASDNLTGIQAAANTGDVAANAGALQAATANAQVLSSAVVIGGSVNRAAGNAALAVGQPVLPSPGVYAE